MISGNQKAFLDMVAASELTPELLAVSDNGYNVLVGSTAAHPLFFSSYADHPRILNKNLHSTAAGRYQLLVHNFDYYKKFLGLANFSPAAQDAIALQQIKECHALPHIEAGNIRIAIDYCSRIWASLPGNSYGQHEDTIAQLCGFYKNAGGIDARGVTA